MVLTADKGVAPVIVEKTHILKNAWAYWMARICTVNAEIRPSPFKPNTYTTPEQKTPLDQNLRISIGNSASGWQQSSCQILWFTKNLYSQQIFSFNNSRAEDIPVLGMKNVFPVKEAHLIQRNYIYAGLSFCCSNCRSWFSLEQNCRFIED